MAGTPKKRLKRELEAKAERETKTQKSRARSIPQMTDEEAQAILDSPLDSCAYQTRLDAYKTIRRLWTLEDCQYMCQMEIELATGPKGAGYRLSWGRELNGIKKALLAAEVEAGKTEVRSTIVVPASRLESDADSADSTDSTG